MLDQLRPNSRLLLITNSVERALAWVQAGIPVGACAYTAIDVSMQQQPGVYVLTYKEVRKRLRHIGAFDFLLVDNTQNMKPIPWESVAAVLQMRNKAINITVYRPKIPVFLQEVEQFWVCGQDRIQRREIAPPLFPNVAGCGHRNKMSHYFCRACGAYRGEISAG